MKNEHLKLVKNLFFKYYFCLGTLLFFMASCAHEVDRKISSDSETVQSQNCNAGEKKQSDGSCLQKELRMGITHSEKH